MKYLNKQKERLLEHYKDRTAIFCYNDEVAFVLLEVFKKAGVRVPQDISVGNEDDSELAVFGGVVVLWSLCFRARRGSYPRFDFGLEKVKYTAVDE